MAMTNSSKFSMLRGALFTLPLLAGGCGSDSDTAPTAASTPTPAPAPAPSPSPAPTPAPMSVQVANWMAAADAQWATAVPAAAERLSVVDGCFLDNGRSRDFNLADLTARSALVAPRDAYRIGEKRTNVRILAERDATNLDGSKRHEVDVQYDIEYKDGSKARGVTGRLIAGSSAGTPGCSTPETREALRLFGNQQIVQVDVRARNVRMERYAMSGIPLSPGQYGYRREVQFAISDPMGKATYAIVSGPGRTDNFPLKMISPRLLRAAPELAGKPGNYMNWPDDSFFRICGPGVAAAASFADCVGSGAVSDVIGLGTSIPDASRDVLFDNYQLVAGGEYTFDIYDDDGWKTVNGHATRSPVASYKVTLEGLPYKFVEMTAGIPANDIFAHIDGPQDRVAWVATALSATPSPVDLTWSALPAATSARGFRLNSVYEYFDGPKATNPVDVPFPAYRYYTPGYPSGGAVSLQGFAITARPADISLKSLLQFALEYSDRNGHVLISSVSFETTP